jgi:23S rRNA pseudouridine1911/1915/1917 synthase
VPTPEHPVHQLRVGPQDRGSRLDAFLASSLGVSRQAAQRRLRLGLVRLEAGRALRASQLLREGETVEVEEEPAPALAEIGPEPRVVYDDGELMVVDKPPGLAVHPAPGLSAPTLTDWLRTQPGPWSLAGGPERPGIVHRLDRGTSGLLALARTDRAHLGLSQQLRLRTMGREYWALAEGALAEGRGRIEAPVGRERARPGRMSVTSAGREAVTEFWVLERLPAHVVLRLRLLSGRTHQIRVHLAYIHHPVAGDTLYGGRQQEAHRPALHAASLHLRHPGTGQEMTFVSPLPGDLRSLRLSLGGQGELVWPWPPVTGA